MAPRLLLAVLGATDWVDGYIARHFDQGSELGKILDPTADRVLLVAAAVALLVARACRSAVDVVIWIVLVREVLIAVATIVLALAGARRIDVVWAGKAGTLALMFALPMFLVRRRGRPSVARVLRRRADGCFAIGGHRARVLRGGQVRARGARRAARRAESARARRTEVRT